MRASGRARCGALGGSARGRVGEPWRCGIGGLRVVVEMGCASVAMVENGGLMEVLWSRAGCRGLAGVAFGRL